MAPLTDAPATALRLSQQGLTDLLSWIGKLAQLLNRTARMEGCVRIAYLLIITVSGIAGGQAACSSNVAGSGDVGSGDITAVDASRDSAVDAQLRTEAGQLADAAIDAAIDVAIDAAIDAVRPDVGAADSAVDRISPDLSSGGDGTAKDSSADHGVDLVVDAPVAVDASSVVDGPPDAQVVADAMVTTDAAAPNGYSEKLCTLTDISKIRAAHSAARLRQTLLDLAKARYPIAVKFIDELLDSELKAFFPNTPGDFDYVVDRFEIAVHEGSHVWTFVNWMGGSLFPHRLRDDLVIKPKDLKNFPRSALVAVHKNISADPYAFTYLYGQGGTADFNGVLDEYSAYVHSLAVRYCLRDQIPGAARTSARDGALIGMYYVGAYLALARAKYATQYAAIVADKEHVRMVVTNWDRAEFYLKLAQGYPQLGLNDQTIRSWTYAADIVSEIDRLRAP